MHRAHLICGFKNKSKMKQQFLQNFLGTTDVAYFTSALVFALLGALISLLIQTSNRDKNSMRTPYKFSWGFMIADNWQRVLLNILLILITVRFCQELTGKKLSLFVALTIGITYDKILELLRNFCVLDKK